MTVDGVLINKGQNELSMQGLTQLNNSVWRIAGPRPCDIDRASADFDIKDDQMPSS